MEEYRHIKLAIGNVSLNHELGTYYIDMRPALIHYQDNLYGGGFDDQGVPMCKNSRGDRFYSPVNIAQYGFILHANWMANKSGVTMDTLRTCLQVLDKKKTISADACVWYNDQYDEKYGLNPPWASSMVQGELISFYLRMFQILGDDHLLVTAQKAYNFLKIDFKEGGVRRIDQEGNLWFEEYPTEKPSLVLNGFIYTIFGLYDLFRVTGDTGVRNDIDSSLKTLKLNLDQYDAGYWSYYDLLKKELVRYYYQQNAHVLQLQVLYSLTAEPVFLHYKNKWEKTLNPLNFLRVKMMYRIRPRLQTLSGLFTRKS